VFGLVEGTEAVGLWLEKRWAEYLTVVATASLLSLEVIELTNHVTVFKAFGFVLNIAVVEYLLWAKRLFGMRGGVAAHNVDVKAILSGPNPQKGRPASDDTPQPS